MNPSNGMLTLSWIKIFKLTFTTSKSNSPWWHRFDWSWHRFSLFQYLSCNCKFKSQKTRACKNLSTYTSTTERPSRNFSNSDLKFSRHFTHQNCIHHTHLESFWVPTFFPFLCTFLPFIAHKRNGHIPFFSQFVHPCKFVRPQCST